MRSVVRRLVAGGKAGRGVWRAVTPAGTVTPIAASSKSYDRTFVSARTSSKRRRMVPFCKDERGLHRR